MATNLRDTSITRLAIRASARSRLRDAERPSKRHAMVDTDGRGLTLNNHPATIQARHGKPEMFNTDQGGQFTSVAFTGMLQAQGIAISMDGRGAWVALVIEGPSVEVIVGPSAIIVSWGPGRAADRVHVWALRRARPMQGREGGATDHEGPPPAGGAA